MKHYIFVFTVLVGISYSKGSAQVNMLPSEGDFGEITHSSDRVLDFKLRNTGSEKAVVLRTELDPDCSFLYSSREILPDSAVNFRIKINPERKGEVKKKGRIWLSTMHAPIEFELKAKVLYLDLSGHTPCPDFSVKQTKCDNCGDIVIQVLDRETSLPLAAARLSIMRNGFVVNDVRSNTNGEVVISPEPGWHSLIAVRPGYLPADTAGYMNRVSNYWQIYLQPQLDTTRVQPEVNLEVKPLSVPIEPTGETAFTEANFAPNNLVFVVDVSQSMAGSGKLDLLKHAMYSLITILRTVDKVSLISYASDTKLLLNGVTGADKDLLMKESGELMAAGMTSGAKAFEAAYLQAREQFIQGGNNHVFVVTDGAFRSGDNNRIITMAKENGERGIETSIIGILPKGIALESLGKVAEAGGGNAFELRTLEEAETLLKHAVIEKSRLR
jgi:Mg-chelatase subunit ChlD